MDETRRERSEAREEDAVEAQRVAQSRQVGCSIVCVTSNRELRADKVNLSFDFLSRRWLRFFAS